MSSRRPLQLYLDIREDARSFQCRLDVARLHCRADARLPWLRVALPGAWYQPSRLVLDLDGDLGQRFGVLAAVVGAEQ
jgi:hypothetical protein